MIKDPMSLLIIHSRLKMGDYYRSKEALLSDLLLMTHNCKKYNDEGTEYFKAAEAMEIFIRDLFADAAPVGLGSSTGTAVSDDKDRDRDRDRDRSGKARHSERDRDKDE
jgi:Bromodomain